MEKALKSVHVSKKEVGLTLPLVAPTSVFSLMAIPGVRDLSFGNLGLVVNVDRDSEVIQQRIMDVFEKQAPSFPYVVKVMDVVQIKK